MSILHCVCFINVKYKTILYFSFATIDLVFSVKFCQNNATVLSFCNQSNFVSLRFAPLFQLNPLMSHCRSFILFLRIDFARYFLCIYIYRVPVETSTTHENVYRVVGYHCHFLFSQKSLSLPVSAAHQVRFNEGELYVCMWRGCCIAFTKHAYLSVFVELGGVECRKSTLADHFFFAFVSAIWSL